MATNQCRLLRRLKLFRQLAVIGRLFTIAQAKFQRTRDDKKTVTRDFRHEGRFYRRHLLLPSTRKSLTAPGWSGNRFFQASWASPRFFFLNFMTINALRIYFRGDNFRSLARIPPGIGHSMILRTRRDAGNALSRLAPVPHNEMQPNPRKFPAKACIAVWRTLGGKAAFSG